MALSEHQTNSSNKSGFTLIEMSIVLVIIGVIMGGVLIGQELLRAAEVRGIVAQVDSLNTAVDSFRSKYNALPGDFSGTISANYLGAGIGGGDGNGLIWKDTGIPDGSIYLFGGGGAIQGELGWVFNHLSKANLMDGYYYANTGAMTSYTVGSNMPFLKNNKGGILLYSYTDYNTYWHLGVRSNTTSTSVQTVNAFSPENAYQVDAKMDDGFANTGLVQARSGTGDVEGAATTAASGTSACLVTGGVYYNTANGKALLCQLRIKVQ
jgi:prepilin-type N-terminal cleavage/methylation domain-containing protein